MSNPQATLDMLKASALDVLGAGHWVPPAHRPTAGQVTVTAIRPQRRASATIRKPRLQFIVAGVVRSELAALAELSRSQAA